MLFYPNIYPHKTETKETAITGVFIVQFRFRWQPKTFRLIIHLKGGLLVHFFSECANQMIVNPIGFHLDFLCHHFIE